MSEEKSGSDGSDARVDPGSTPSLSGLAGRIRERRNRSDSSADAAPAKTSGDPGSTVARTTDDSEFFFPADSSPDNDARPSPDNDARPDETREIESMAQELADTPIDNRPDSGRNDTPVQPGPDRNQGTESGERFGSDAKTEAIIELIGDVQNLLLLGPPHSPADYELCANLMVPQDDPPEHLFLVTFEKSPDERLNILRGHLGTLPDSIAMLNVGDATRSGSSEIVPTTGPDGISVDNVSDPTDVQRMGLTINKYLSKWDDDGETVLCFHSLTDLLDAVDSETVFRFLNVLLGRVRSGDVSAHYHIDPDAHDDQILEMYRPLFDEHIRVEEDGSVRIDR